MKKKGDWLTGIKHYVTIFADYRGDEHIDIYFNDLLNLIQVSENLKYPRSHKFPKSLQFPGYLNSSIYLLNFSGIWGKSKGNNAM